MQPKLLQLQNPKDAYYHPRVHSQVCSRRLCLLVMVHWPCRESVSPLGYADILEPLALE